VKPLEGVPLESEFLESEFLESEVLDWERQLAQFAGAKVLWQKAELEAVEIQAGEKAALLFLLEFLLELLLELQAKAQG
jgi:hypothetical protein